ncbi:hypothetical protein CASFOL_000932 [Castilleja foliolosa]|uniref:Peptidase A1 domain-containing protein n=1 Tax=Castilleja foliolosa TaxID=1961234 RepID=A0ABD3ELN2_9LAMI
MTETQISFAVSVTCLILSLISFPCSSSSPDQQFQVFDVSASLQQTHQVFSIQQTQFSTSSTVQHDSGLSLTLHPRPVFLFNNNINNNYTSLTLSRLKRDEAHVHSRYHPKNLESPVISGLSQGSGEYFARIGVGRPAKKFSMVIDSGSDLNWLQCKPCFDCYNQSDPIFNPSTSSTYKPLPCNSNECKSLQDSACRIDSCLYQISYGDNSYTVGNLATETISFGSSGNVPNVAIGCGHNNEGLFSGAAGLLGLGGGPLSLPSQIKAKSFSYCLVNRDSSLSSTLDFNSAQPNDSVLAPLLINRFVKTFRYVHLTGISVGGRAVNIPPYMFELGRDGRGGVIIDSGTAVTRFRVEVYELFRDAFVSMTRGLPLADGFSLFDTCYDLSTMARVTVPTVSFRFSRGKTLPLQPSNYLIPVDNAGKFCFAFAGMSGSMSIIGNVQQQGIRVSYDLANNFIAFSPNKC